MADIGLKGFYVGTYAEDSTGITYTNGKKVRQAIKASINWEKKEAKLYADNGLADKVTSIAEGTVEITPDGIDEEVLKLIGITKQTVNINGTEKQMYATTTNNEGAFVGFGYIVQQRIDAIDKYAAKLISKVRFTVGSGDSYDTQGDSLNFNTPAISGTAYKDKYDNYVYEEVFDTEEEAVEALEEMLGFNGTPTPTNEESY